MGYLTIKRLPRLFIIAGCNGAGKTTASYILLPELLHIKEFVNADEIARGLSPFQPETVSIEAGKIMLRRLQDLLSRRQDFALETTLASKNYNRFIDQARQLRYSITLVYYWLESVELAIKRVKIRVAEGGHDIPQEVIIRRYYSGLKNFMYIYKNKVDYWVLVDNSETKQETIAEGHSGNQYDVINQGKWKTIHSLIAP